MSVPTEHEGQSMAKKIDDVYTGSVAAKYDEVRGKLPRWKSEAAIIEPILRTIPRGSTLLDVAAGTARWLPIYKELDLTVTLTDASADMLAIAAEKARALGVPATVRRISAIDAEPFPSAQTVVTTNFLNWISLPDVEIALRKMRQTGAETLLLMIAYIPENWPRSKRAQARVRIGWKNLRSRIGIREKGIYHLHDEKDVRAMFRRLGLEIVEETTISETPKKRVSFVRARPVSELPIITIDEIVVSEKSAMIDGKQYSIKSGTWAFYVPDLEMKILRAAGGNCAYEHPLAPDPQEVRAAPKDQRFRRYSAGEWSAAINKPVLERAAENCIIAQRLAREGLGAAIRAAVVVRSYRSGAGSKPSLSGGMVVDNLETYPRRADVTEAEFRSAGLVPDKIKSSIRQQIRGYVSDFNAVIGVTPIGGEREIAALAARMGALA
jgi:SAM-dependent methyltransferase